VMDSVDRESWRRSALGGGMLQEAGRHQDGSDRLQKVVKIGMSGRRMETRREL
jgi:predicted transcriptional regulator